MQDIQIIPIFNQRAPGIWANFARIESKTILDTYNCHESEQTILAWIKSGAGNMHIYTHFAFGAYASDEMIGFVRGNLYKSWATILSLYVLHDFQGMKIGRRLLNAAEQASSVMARNIGLTAMDGAKTFYRARGYREDTFAHEFVKTSLPAPLCACVPLFGCNRAIERNINQFMPSFDAKLIKKYHIPAFAYFDVGGNIVGCAFDDKVAVSDGVHYRDIVGNALRRSIARVR